MIIHGRYYAGVNDKGKGRVMLANNRQVKSTGKNKWQQAKGRERDQRTKKGQGARGQGRKEGERIKWSRQRSWKEAANRLEICQKIYTTQFSGERILHTENA